MEPYRATHSSQDTPEKEPRQKSFAGPRLPNRHSLCLDDRYPLGNVTPGDGLWLRHDLLATLTRLAASGGMDRNPPNASGPIAQRRPDRLHKMRRRQCDYPCCGGGEKTGPSPVDRRKPGSKHHLLTDGRGIPIVAHTTAANQHDVTEMLELVNDVPGIKGKVGRPRYRFEELLADRAYDSDPHREALKSVGITPRIARRNTEHGSGLGVYRWVVERTISWLHQFRRLRIRYERCLDIHQAFLLIACIIICHRYLEKSFC
jgi:transposase